MEEECEGYIFCVGMFLMYIVSIFDDDQNHHSSDGVETVDTDA